MLDPSEQIGAVLLFGPPAAGKNLVCLRLLDEHGNMISKFLDVRAELRSRGLVDEYLKHPTDESRRATPWTARELLESACAELMAPSSAACSGPRCVQATHICCDTLCLCLLPWTLHTWSSDEDLYVVFAILIRFTLFVKERHWPMWILRGQIPRVDSVSESRQFYLHDDSSESWYFDHYIVLSHITIFEEVVIPPLIKIRSMKNEGQADVVALVHIGCQSCRVMVHVWSSISCIPGGQAHGSKCQFKTTQWNSMWHASFTVNPLHCWHMHYTVLNKIIYQPTVKKCMYIAYSWMTRW